MRWILAIGLGVAAALAIMTATEALAHFLYPFPQGFETLDRGELAIAMQAVPLPAKAIVAAGWLLAAFVGVWLALRIADRRWTGWVIVGLMLAGGVVNLVMLPHPWWMQIAAVAAPFAGGWLAARLHHTPYRGEPLLG